jgi:type 1 fimbriae regulatory protein FimB/type 1 fimbriae regulatory protein FimE
MKRKSKVPPQYLTTEEIDRFFRVITRARDRALFRVAYHRGLRASELGLLQLSDYRPNAGRLFVRRLKGSRSGEYHLTQAEQQNMRAWLRVQGSAPGPLFVSRNHKPISRWRLDQLMKRYCKCAGIPPEKAHMHALKHSCGTHLSAQEPDIVAIQDHLGHANIQNTMTYVQIASKRRDEFADRLRDWGLR